MSKPRDVFISYHTDSAGDQVRKIAAALEGAGISCWYAPRDCGANYAGSIVEAIRACRVYLLILNEQSNLSAHILNEINCAFDRFRNHEDITLLPFRVDHCTLSDDVYYYLGRIRIMDGAVPPEVQRIQELVDRISMLLGQPHTQMATACVRTSPGVKTYRLLSSMVYPDNCFVGRERELADIHAQLSGAENKLLLVGMGGIGKSEIAKMYCKRHAADYDVVLWVSFDRSLQQTIISDYAFPIQGLERTDYPEDSDRDYFLRKLRVLKEIAGRRVLLVMDNFDVPDDPDLTDFCSGAYSVLFTTRCQPDGGSLPAVTVEEMKNEDELLALFCAEYHRPLGESALGCVRGIFRLLGGHTLSIRLVASAMQSRRISPEKMAALLREGEQGMAAQNAKAADLIFGRLRQVFRLSTLSEDEQYLLKNLSLISLRGIAVETLFDWCGLDDFDVIDGLIQKSWVIHNPVTDEVHLHPLVADLMCEALAADPDCCSSLIGYLAEACCNVIGTTFERKQQLFDYATSVYDRLPAGHPLSWAALRCKADLNMDMSLYSVCIPLYRELMEQSTALFGRIYAYEKISHSQALSGNAESCYQTALEGYALVKDIPDDEIDPDVGYRRDQLIKRLCESTRNMGDYDTSIAWGRKALETCERFYRTTPQENRGWTEYHLACSLYMKGEYDESEALFLHAIDLFDEINDEWAKSFSYDLLGQIAMQHGKFDEALELSSRAYGILLPQLGETHVDIGNNLEWRGMIYRAMGDAEKANGCFRRAADIFRMRNCPNREAATLALMETHESV